MLEEIMLTVFVVLIILYFIGKYLYEKYNDED